MRLYTFNNYYLSSLQQGLQTAHVVGQLNAKYVYREIDRTGLSEQEKEISLYNQAMLAASSFFLYDWQDNHKTIIMLNGGNAGNIKAIFNFINDRNVNPYPFAIFYEDEQSLNGSATSVGIVLPERIYNTAEKDRFYGGKQWHEIASSKNWPIPDSHRPWDLTPFEEELIDQLKNYRLAN